MKGHNCDILVVGGGGSGLVAAVRARELSGKKVVVLESGRMPGGGMLFASTMRTFHSRWQQERHIPDQANDFIRKGMDLTLWKLNPKLVTRAVLGTGAFFDWYYEKELPEIQAKYEARPYVFDIPVQGPARPPDRRLPQRLRQIHRQHHGAPVPGAGHRHSAEPPGGGRPGGRRENHRHSGRDPRRGSSGFAARSVFSPAAAGSKTRRWWKRSIPPSPRRRCCPTPTRTPNYRGDGLTIAQKAGAFIDWSKFCLRVMGPICSFTETSPL